MPSCVLDLSDGVSFWLFCTISFFKEQELMSMYTYWTKSTPFLSSVQTYRSLLPPLFVFLQQVFRGVANLLLTLSINKAAPVIIRLLMRRRNWCFHAKHWQRARGDTVWGWQIVPTTPRILAAQRIVRLTVCLAS